VYIDFFAISRRRHGNDFGVHDVRDAGAVGRSHELAQRHDADQPTILVHDVNRVHGIARTGSCREANLRQRFLDAQRLLHGHEARGHQPAGRVRLELQQLFGFLSRLVGQVGENLVGGLFLERFQHVRRIVRRHLRNDLGGLFGRYVLEELCAIPHPVFDDPAARFGAMHGGSRRPGRAATAQQRWQGRRVHLLGTAAGRPVLFQRARCPTSRPR
jgi:hypothetical protein